eukprot:jgi/Galph1/3202/GphlegSOOS_G1862.1
MTLSKFILLGGSGGIGSKLCQQLASKDVRIVVGSRSERKLKELQDCVSEVDTFQVDATDSKQVEEFVKFAEDRPGNLVGAANLVGSIILKPLIATSDEDFLHTVKTNLYSSFYFTRSIIRRMVKNQQGGSILNFASAVVLHGVPNHEAIAAAKAGVVGLSLSTAATYASKNIRVNCIAPGLVQTELSEFLTNSPSALKASTAMHPLGRIGTPSQVAKLAAFLLQPENHWITGQTFAIDGGLSALK